LIFERDNWQEIFATIRKNKLRTFLTMLGVFWGIFMLVIMLGAGNGLRNGVLKEFAGTATNSFYIWAQRTSKAYKGMQPNRSFNYTTVDTERLKLLPELEVVSPINQLGGHEGTNNVIRGLKTAACEIQACYPNIAKISNIKMKDGRFVNEMDINEKRKICVIGPRVVEMLYKKDEKVIGTYIRVNGVYFMVVGVTVVTQGGNDGREQAQRINIPYSTFQNAFNYGNVVGWFAIKAKDNVSAEEAEKHVMSILKERHKIAPNDLKAIGHVNLAVEYKKLNGLFIGIEVLVWIVGIGTLLAGVIGISNIMLIVVKERTKEIGVKRALGAVPAQIVGQIVLEAIFLTSISGYFGLVIGIGLLEALDSAIGNSGEMFTNPTVDLSVAIKALSVLILSGAFAGLIPASKAVAIKPVEALRTE
jgi:putative ABC transport system permease protein